MNEAAYTELMRLTRENADMKAKVAALEQSVSLLGDCLHSISKDHEARIKRIEASLELAPMAPGENRG